VAGIVVAALFLVDRVGWISAEARGSFFFLVTGFAKRRLWLMVLWHG
jgi:hypothetical protein